MSAIVLRPGSVEYVHWQATGLPADPPVGSVQISIDDAVTWHTATVTASVVSLLVSHPDTVGADSSAVAALDGSHEMLVRLTDTPEVVIRSGGWLTTV